MKFYFPWRRYRNRPAIATPLSNAVDISRCTTTSTSTSNRDGFFLRRAWTSSFHPLSPPHRIDQIYRRTCREPWPDSRYFMIHFSILPFDSYYEWFGKEDQASLIWEIVQLLPTVLFWIRLFFSKIFRRKYIYRNLFDLSLVIMLLEEKLN